MSKSRNINVMWTSEEESFLIEKYSNSDWDYLLKNLSRHTKNQICSKANYLGLKRERVWSFDDIEILKNIYPNSNSVDDVVEYFNKKYTKKQIIKKANKMGLIIREYLPKSYKNISDLIRSNNNFWKIKVLMQYNYKCILTGSKDVNIHHIVPFKELLNESYDLLKYDKNCILSDNETNEIIRVFNILQDKENVGICINSDIHKLFHRIYSYTNCNKEDWDIFFNDIINGKYNEFLERKNLNIDYYTMKKWSILI